jgi:large-conductance mechanosensitive channel
VSLTVKKVVAWLVIAFVVFYVIKQPDNSARLVRDAGHALGEAASSLATFIGSIF